MIIATDAGSLRPSRKRGRCGWLAAVPRATAGLPSLPSSPGRNGDGPGRIRQDRHRIRNGRESRHVCSPPSHSFCSYLRKRHANVSACGTKRSGDCPSRCAEMPSWPGPGGRWGQQHAGPGGGLGAARARPRGMRGPGPGPVIARTEPVGASPRYRCEITP